MFSRHELVWLSARGWERACAAAPPASRAAIACWGAAGWPAVVTRRPASLEAGQVALGIALPPRPDGSKPRIGVHADAADIVRTHAPMRLGHAIPTAPGPWRTALASLDDEAGRAGLALRVYGSLAFQALTGQPYVSATSDIDLLLHPATPAEYQRALALLARHTQALPLDGELAFAGGYAVAWKELAACPHGQARVLAKSLHGVSLVTIDALLAASSEDAPCTS
ncbi:malonate decarboxylase holo-[acyl-carrier-protein] synthase [Massilia sp. CMS3.1]|uniref:malonate decarboxylase holo-[acyl-carrier-protein] synthase n=1 Tax=Massilia sp. CMS3.1 TaxID=3373083 RepID=UPI003EE6075D